MFKRFSKFIKKTMECVRVPVPPSLIEKTNETESEHVIMVVSDTTVQEMTPAQVPVQSAKSHDYKYQPDIDVILAWNHSAKNDIAPLIAMIRQLLFFSDLKKCTIRSYGFTKDDIVSIVEKTKRRPALEIDVSDIDVHDHPQIFRMYRNMHSIIGMHRTSHFMVRVEHAFDNTQIESEHFVVSRLMNISSNSDVVAGCGIDSVHHIVLPIHVELKNITKIPIHARTIFHHISYSIQPIVFHSQTLDTWVKNAMNLTNAQVMQLCVQLAEAVHYLHQSNVVHGDIKPGNILVKNNRESDITTHDKSLPSFLIYLIDFGMSGEADVSDGTGGTVPFCAPETGNGANIEKKGDIELYKWTKVQKCHDVWSMGLMFMTIIVFGKSYVFPKNYPSDFFDENGHVNPTYFDKIPNESLRNLFEKALLPETERITSYEFLTLARSIQFDVVDPLSKWSSSRSGSGSGSDD